MIYFFSENELFEGSGGAFGGSKGALKWFFGIRFPENVISVLEYIYFFSEINQKNTGPRFSPTLFAISQKSRRSARAGQPAGRPTPLFLCRNPPKGCCKKIRPVFHTQKKNKRPPFPQESEKKVVSSQLIPIRKPSACAEGHRILPCIPAR